MSERTDKAGLALGALERLYGTSLESELGRHVAEPAAEAALALFRCTLSGVPAYGRFLEEAGFDAGDVRSAADFSRLPTRQ